MIDVGGVVIGGDTHMPRGYHQEKFTALVEDEHGSRWVTVGAIVRRIGTGQPERLVRVHGWSEECTR